MSSMYVHVFWQCFLYTCDILQSHYFGNLKVNDTITYQSHVTHPPAVSKKVLVLEYDVSVIGTGTGRVLNVVKVTDAIIIQQ